jgi:hypothetical protein
MNKELLKKMADPEDDSWVKVKAWNNGAMQQNWGTAFDELMAHHIKEVSFLRSTIANLAKELLDKVYDKEMRYE